MAVLLVPEDRLKNALYMKALRNYFDEFIGLEKKNGFAKYFVYKEGLPQDNTQVEAFVSKDELDAYQVINVAIKTNKV